MSKLKSLFSKVPVFLNSTKLYPVELCMTLFLFISVVIIFEAISIADDESKISPYANFFIQYGHLLFCRLSQQSSFVATGKTGLKATSQNMPIGQAVCCFFSLDLFFPNTK